MEGTDKAEFGTCWALCYNIRQGRSGTPLLRAGASGKDHKKLVFCVVGELRKVRQIHQHLYLGRKGADECHARCVHALMQWPRPARAGASGTLWGKTLIYLWSAMCGVRNGAA
ncbi:hypothetical protein CSR02_06940 [Acetobacter pomorum]|uniref:Uncharacterized protein n=1 Tax=Acetobacter pomorum TaxID=65959 RepID=A0A2G4RCR8_9PROT|nr:hypothetical protein CSR02_06940 [Acetobacter pomorum]